MDYSDITELFFDINEKSIIIHSTPINNFQLPIILHKLRTEEINQQGITPDIAHLLARGKHPFMIVRRMDMLLKDYSALELMEHIDAVNTINDMQYMLWFYLLTTEQLQLMLNEFVTIFIEREVIIIRRGEKSTFITNVKKDERLEQVFFRSNALPGSIHSA